MTLLKPAVVKCVLACCFVFVYLNCDAKCKADGLKTQITSVLTNCLDSRVMQVKGFCRPASEKTWDRQQQTTTQHMFCMCTISPCQWKTKLWRCKPVCNSAFLLDFLSSLTIFWMTIRDHEVLNVVPAMRSVWCLYAAFGLCQFFLFLRLIFITSLLVSRFAEAEQSIRGPLFQTSSNADAAVVLGTLLKKRLVQMRSPSLGHH